MSDKYLSTSGFPQGEQVATLKRKMEKTLKGYLFELEELPLNIANNQSSLPIYPLLKPTGVQSFKEKQDVKQFINEQIHRFEEAMNFTPDSSQYLVTEELLKNMLHYCKEMSYFKEGLILDLLLVVHTINCSSHQDDWDLLPSYFRKFHSLIFTAIQNKHSTERLVGILALGIELRGDYAYKLYDFELATACNHWSIQLLEIGNVQNLNSHYSRAIVRLLNRVHHL